MTSPSLPDSRPSRRRTATPGPATPPARPFGGGRRRSPALVWIGAAVLGLLTAGVGAWRWLHRPAAPAPIAGTASSPAVARLLAAAAREPASPRPYLELAEQYSSDGHPASALWAYAEASARAPQDDAVRRKLAAMMVSLGQALPAETALREVATKQGPEGTQARRVLAELLLSTGRPSEALAAIRPLGSEGAVLR